MQNIFYLNLELKKMISILAQDPSCREEIEAALAQDPVKLTDRFGNVQIGEDWFTVFAGTNRERQTGQEGLVYRTKSESKAIKLNLRRQSKEHAADAQTKPVSVMAEKIVSHNDALINALEQLKNSAQALSTYVAPKVQASEEDETLF